MQDFASLKVRRIKDEIRKPGVQSVQRGKVPMNPGDELVDVVDAAGNTIGVVTRRVMRGQRLPHRCVYLLVFNARGELFIHQRTAAKDVFPSYWDVAIGGVLGAGEAFDD